MSLADFFEFRRSNLRFNLRSKATKDFSLCCNQYTFRLFVSGWLIFFDFVRCII